MGDEQTREEIQSTEAKNKKFKRQMGAVIAIGIILTVAYFKGKANEQRDDKMKRTQATAADEVAKKDTTRSDAMPHGIIGGEVRNKGIENADTAFVKMSEKQEEEKKADAQKKAGAPTTVVNVWDESRGGSGSLPAGVAPDGSAGSAYAEGSGPARPPSFIPDGSSQDPATKAAREQNMRYYDPRYYYKTTGGYVRPGYQTGATTPTADKIHEAMEMQYFASFSSPTTVGADPKSAEALKVLRGQFADVRFAIWPGQPPAKPIRDEARASGSSTPKAGEARPPQPKPRVE